LLLEQLSSLVSSAYRSSLPIRLPALGRWGKRPNGSGTATRPVRSAKLVSHGV
jgi:hypothetical protein